MPERCVAARCSNVADREKHISMHKIPFFGEKCPIKQKSRKRWIDFVLERIKMWVPGKTSLLCSEHFTVDDFERPLNMELNLKRELKKDSIGFCVYPTKHAKREGEDDEPPSKRRRDKRMVRKNSHTCSWHSLWFFSEIFLLVHVSLMFKKDHYNCVFFWYRSLDLRSLAWKRWKNLKDGTCYFRSFHELSGGKQPIIKIMNDFYFSVYLGMLEELWLVTSSYVL